MSHSTPQHPTRRSLRQHRRAESAAGAPEGSASVSGFIEIPAAASTPTDISAWTGMITQVAAGQGSDVSTAGDQASATVAQPRTRREARRLRELGLLPDSTSSSDATAEGTAPTRARRADAPVTTVDADRVNGVASDAPAVSESDAERESIAQEAAALAQLIADADHSDPTAVDPEIQRRQEALAERAARLNAPAGLPSSGRSFEEAAPEPEPTAHHRPVQASNAHGLDSLAAAESVGRERRTLLIAAAVLAVGLIALVVALILILT